MENQSFVFLPGMLCNEDVFRYQTKAFLNNVVVDLRHSPTIDDMIEAVHKVLSPKFNLIGFSMGGHIAQEFALKFPERVERLILMGSSSEGYPVEEKKKVLSSLGSVERGHFIGVVDERLKEHLHPSSFANVTLRELIRTMAGADAKEVYLRQMKATLERRNLIGEMKHLKVPTMFMAGVGDSLIPIESIRRSAENVANAKFHAVANCGHYVPLEQPAVVNMYISDFISTT